MPFDADDIAAFNDPDMPGYALATIGGDEVGGRFRAPYAESLRVGGDKPSFSAASADLAGVVLDGALTIADESYTIDGIEPNPSTGQTLLRLKRSGS